MILPQTRYCNLLPAQHARGAVGRDPLRLNQPQVYDFEDVVDDRDGIAGLTMESESLGFAHVWKVQGDSRLTCILATPTASVRSGHRIRANLSWFQVVDTRRNDDSTASTWYLLRLVVAVAVAVAWVRSPSSWPTDSCVH